MKVKIIRGAKHKGESGVRGSLLIAREGKTSTRHLPNRGEDSPSIEMDLLALCQEGDSRGICWNGRSSFESSDRRRGMVSRGRWRLEG